MISLIEYSAGNRKICIFYNEKKGEMNNDIIYNFTNDIITDRFGSDRDYCRRSDTATDIRRCDCVCIDYLFHCKILHTEEEMRPITVSFFFFTQNSHFL